MKNQNMISKENMLKATKETGCQIIKDALGEVGIQSDIERFDDESITATIFIYADNINQDIALRAQITLNKDGLQSSIDRSCDPYIAIPDGLLTKAKNEIKKAYSAIAELVHITDPSYFREPNDWTEE